MAPAANDDRQRRSVRSFVRRAGRMTGPQRRALEELWPRYGIDGGTGLLPLDEIFGRRAARVLEIGFGNGETLVGQAAANPGIDYLGVEVHEPGIGHCLIAAERAGIGNLRLLAGDAVEILPAKFPPGSLSRINLYFPDPWPKKRHHKRRILNEAFLESCASCLESGGSLNIATDWANYAAHIDELLARSGDFLLAERREHDGDAPLDRPVTKFERRGLACGHRIVDWRFVRRG